MNLLITSVGRRSYMITYFSEVLKDTGEVHAANSEMTYAMSLADKSIITPSIYNDSYIDFVIDYCRANKIEMVISLFDIDLGVLSKNKKRFQANGINLIVSDHSVIETCNDKWLTYNFLRENNILTPLSFIDIETFKNALRKRQITYPVIIKPRWGMGSIGIYEAEDENELYVLYNKTKNAIQKSYLKYESQVAIDHSIIIQEKLVGAEYGLDIFNDLKANHVCTIAKRKIAMRAGETDIAEVIKSPELEKLGELLSIRLLHIANLDVDCFLVGDEFYVLELNPRFGGQYPFSHLSGVNFPKMIIDLLLRKTVDRADFLVQYNTIGFKDLSIKAL